MDKIFEWQEKFRKLAIEMERDLGGKLDSVYIDVVSRDDSFLPHSASEAIQVKIEFR